MKRILPLFLVLSAASSALAAAPTLTSINPTSNIAGSGSFALTLNGTNFTTSSTVAWQAGCSGGSTNLTPVTFDSSTQLRVTVPAALIASAGTACVSVSNPNPGGGTSAKLTFTINQPPPVITSATAASGTIGSAFSYTITATNNPTSFNATGLPAGLTVNTSTGLISGTPTTAGTYSVTISATNAGGTGSATLTLTIVNPPPPVITSATTASGQVGVAFSYQITATNNPTSFNATGLAAGLTVNTTTGVISGTPTIAGTYSVTISATNAGGTGSATLTLTINNPVPTTTSISPASTTAGSAQFTLTVNGTNFVSTSTVNWNGSALATTFVSSTKLTAIVPAANVAAAGTAFVTVVNPAPGGGTSNAQTFTINPPPPVITSPTTATGQVGVAFSYTITATNGPTSYNATGLPAGLSVNTSSGVISGTPTTAGTSNVTISATNAGGTGSATLVITINPAKPVITSPLTATGTVGVAFSYTITATNNPTSYNATVLPAGVLPAGLSVNTSTGVISGTPTTAGTYSVTISATNAGGTGSATLILTINNQVPTTTSISPTCTTAGSADFTLTVNGTKFVSTSTVNWNGTPLTTSFVSSTQLTATVPASLVATAGTASITVVTPSPGGGTSNAKTFTISATPVVTSPLTACGTVGVAFSYTITATNNPTSFTATGLPPGLKLETPPPSSDLGLIDGTPTTAGTYNVTITANNGASSCNTSAQQTLVITIGAKPTITSLSPTCAAAGGPDFTLTVNGTNYVSTSIVNWNGTALTTTFVSSTQLTATVPASLITTTGGASITVSNPCAGATSSAVTFTIANTPVITSPLTVTGQTGVAFSYTITATGNPTSYTATGLPPGLSLGSGPNQNVISGTPTTDGTYNVTITATNGAGLCGTDTETLVITIIATPVITSSLTATGTAGGTFSYQITATSSPTSFDAEGLPGGLSVDPTTGLISGSPTGVGVFPVTISATNAIGTGSATLTLTITLPSGVTIPPFSGEPNVFDTGLGSDPSDPIQNPNFTITFPNTTTDNYFQLYWNLPGTSKQNQGIIDLARGGLRRDQNLSPGMKYNGYDPTGQTPGLPRTPDPTKNVWRGNPSPPNNNSSGQFGDPRASWYITDPWPSGDYVNDSYWGGPTPQILPLTWPDSGHPFDPLQVGKQPSGPGQTPVDIMAGPTPAPAPSTKSISLLSTVPRNELASVAELGNVFDPAQLKYSVTNPGGDLPDIPSSATLDSKGGGGHTLAIGRPEFSRFDTNGMRAWQLLDVFGLAAGTTNTAGLINLNTASFEVLRALAAGILQNRDQAIVPSALTTSLYPPTAGTPTSSEDPSRSSGGQADLFAQAVINSRPLLSTSALSAIRVTPPGGSQPEPFFGNPHQYSNQTAPTEWNDPGREELFAKIFNLATTRSRNFRVFVTGQSLDKNGNVLSTVTKVYQVFIKPNRDPTTGAIQSQQVEIRYEGSM